MIKVATVFSGIGSIEHALKRMKIQHELVFACDNGEINLDVNEKKLIEEIAELPNHERKIIIDKLYEKSKKNNYVQQTYLANYELDPKNFYQDIRFLDGNEFRNSIDLFVGGSPCQSFSINGHRRGLEDARGTLFYDYARLVKEIQPKVFIYENVPGMLSHDNGTTFEVISNIFDSLNYTWKLEVLNSSNFGIPQNRKRIFIVGIRNGLDAKQFSFPQSRQLNMTVKDFLDNEVDEKYYHSEKGFKWITKDSSLKRRVSINSKIARTLSANQQFNWCGDMVFYPIEKKQWARNNEKVFIGDYKGVTGVARKITPRECLRLMGYSDDFKIVVPDTQMYRQAGNSIVVNILESIISSILKTKVLGEIND